ncbi:MAG: STAS domain-containing protein [Acidobacteriota bacterium]|nr:STAS domain-containing protein [Acidobacteriota bacterium]
MTVDFEYAGDILVLRLRGRFATGQDTSYLRTKAEEIKASGKNKVLMDFSGVSYIDSTGIGFLIGIYTSVRKLPEGQFVMTCANQRVREVLDLTRLSKVIPCYDSEPDAMEALKSGRQSASSVHGG